MDPFKFIKISSIVSQTIEDGSLPTFWVLLPCWLLEIDCCEKLRRLLNCNKLHLNFNFLTGQGDSCWQCNDALDHARLRASIPENVVAQLHHTEEGQCPASAHHARKEQQ